MVFMSLLDLVLLDIERFYPLNEKKERKLCAYYNSKSPKLCTDIVAVLTNRYMVF